MGEPGGDVDDPPVRLAQGAERGGGDSPRTDQVDVENPLSVGVGALRRRFADCRFPRS